MGTADYEGHAGKRWSFPLRMARIYAAVNGTLSMVTGHCDVRSGLTTKLTDHGEETMSKQTRTAARGSVQRLVRCHLQTIGISVK